MVDSCCVDGWELFFGKIDIREHGSNNPGATNTLRVLGKKAAVIVLLIDVGKGALAALLPLFFDVNISPFYPGLIAVIGHCFPIFAGFRGGKAIATTAGMLLVADIQLFFITYICFILIVISKYVFFSGLLSVGIVLLVYALMDADHKTILSFSFFYYY